nr:MAG TPA: hypothetical protein [Caudoviricetes sp.]
MAFSLPKALIANFIYYATIRPQIRHSGAYSLRQKSFQKK